MQFITFYVGLKINISLCKSAKHKKELKENKLTCFIIISLNLIKQFKSQNHNNQRIYRQIFLHCGHKRSKLPNIKGFDLTMVHMKYYFTFIAPYFSFTIFM